MNNKRTTYEKAKGRLKLLTHIQRCNKEYAKFRNSGKLPKLQQEMARNKKEINLLLSIVTERKEASRMYGVLRELRDTLGMSTKERKLVEKILND